MEYNKIQVLDRLKRYTTNIRKSISGEPTPETQAIWNWEDARYRMMRELYLRQQMAAAEAADDDDDDFNIIITTKEKHK